MNNDFLKNLVDDKVVSFAEISSLIELYPDLETWNAQKIANALYQHGGITEYQRNELLQGRRRFSIGPYVIRDWLTTSGSNSIFEARYNGGARYFINIHNYNSATRTSKQRFSELALCSSRMRTEIVMNIVDMDLHSEVLFVAATEDEESVSLEQFVSEHGYLELHQCVSIGTRLSQGLSEARSLGIALGDVCPRTVRVSKAQQLACLMPTLASDWLIGSSAMPSFSPPERLKGDAQATTASDIYGLGCCIYFCLTGRFPFYFARREQLSKAIMKGQIFRPSNFVPDIPKKLEELIASMVDTTPRNRPLCEDVFRTLQRL